MTPGSMAAIREAADYLRGQSYSTHERWTAAEARRLADQLDAVLADVEQPRTDGQLPLQL
jgi:CheY-like chemotaxis protein